MSSIKHIVAMNAVDVLLAVASRTPDRVFQKLLRLLALLPIDPVKRRLVGSLGKHWEPGTTYVQFLKRIYREVSPRCRRRLIGNIVTGYIWGTAKEEREAFKLEMGFIMPLTFLISPTMRCNLHCDGCYAGDYSASSEMPLAEINRILTEGKQLGCHFVTILGGAPSFARICGRYTASIPTSLFRCSRMVHC